MTERVHLQNRRRNDDTRKKTIVKIAIMLILALLIIVFATIAWFVRNHDFSAFGMGITPAGDLFTINALGNPAHAGIYDDDSLVDTFVRDKLFDEANRDSGTIIWTITDDVATTNQETGVTTVTKGKNIGNGPATGYEGGIGPGSSGELQFVIRPSKPIDAEFTFYVYSYSGGYDEHGDEDKSTIELIATGSSSESLIAQNLLNGHLLLFSGMDPNTGKLYGLIDSNEDLERIMTASYSSQETVSIYWIWPETLAELLLDENVTAQARNMHGKQNICTSEGRAEVITFFKSHVDYFLLDPVDSSHDWSETFDSSSSNDTIVTTINNNYALYSAYYNEADQCIGTNVSYILVDMDATASASSGD